MKEPDYSHLLPSSSSSSLDDDDGDDDGDEERESSLPTIGMGRMKFLPPRFMTISEAVSQIIEVIGERER